MYKPPEPNEYQDEWLQAERDLAINTLRFLGWVPSIQEEATPSENIPEPTNQSDQQKSEDQFTKSDFIKALKKVSRRIEKPKPSPKQSKT